jgi:FkbM family methyltransferase
MTLKKLEHARASSMLRVVTKKTIKRFWVIVFGKRRFSRFNSRLFQLSAWGLGYDVYEEVSVKRLQGRTRVSLTEPPEMKFYDSEIGAAILENSRVIYDVGANSGTWTKAIIGRLGDDPGRAYYLYEPNPIFARDLKPLTRTIKGVTNKSEAVGANAEYTSLLVPEGGASHGFLDQDQNITYDFGSRYTRNQSVEQKIEVSVVTLDDEIRSGHCVADLLKIDVEGSTFAVLEGAKFFLESNPNMTVQFEGDFSWMAYRNRIISSLAPRTIFRILPNGELLSGVTGLESELYAFCNLIALPPQQVRKYQATLAKPLGKNRFETVDSDTPSRSR